MNKKLLTLAVGAALAATSGIAAAEVNWYGKFNLNIENVDVDSSTTDGQTDLTSGGSRLGLRASDDLDNGMTAWVWAEWKIDVTDAGAVDATGSNSFDTRDAFVGLTGDFGTIAAGTGGSAYKGFAGGHDFFGDSYADVGSWGVFKPAGEGIGYNNSVGDISFAIGTSLDDNSTTNDSDSSGSIVYSAGDLSIGVAAYSQDDGNNDNTISNAESATAIGVKWAMDSINVHALFQAAGDIGGTVGNDADTMVLGASIGFDGVNLNVQHTATDYDLTATAGAYNDSDVTSVGLSTNLSDNVSAGIAFHSGTNAGGVAADDGDAWGAGITVNF